MGEKEEKKKKKKRRQKDIYVYINFLPSKYLINTLTPTELNPPAPTLYKATKVNIKKSKIICQRAVYTKPHALIFRYNY